MSCIRITSSSAHIYSSCARTKSMFLHKKKVFALLQEEHVLLVREEDIILVQEDKLTLIHQKCLLLVQEDNLLPVQKRRSSYDVWTKCCTTCRHRLYKVGQTSDDFRQSSYEDRVLSTKFLRR